MKRSFLSIAFLLAGITILQAQVKTLKKIMELKMPKTAEDDMPGTRGACVTWHPVQKKYYAVMAGNAAYPMAVFDTEGKILSDEDLTAMNDSRGIWYNPKTEEINGNGHDETGWFKFTLDEDGIPESSDIIFEGSHQPDPQCVGAFNTETRQVMFLNNGIVSLYAPNGVNSSETVEINWGKKKTDPKSGGSPGTTPEEYNYTSVIFTGIKNAELGFLNTAKKQIELYDFSSGYLTQKIKLPEDAPVESAFNFAYANNTYWLFNIKARTWYGYR